MLTPDNAALMAAAALARYYQTKDGRTLAHELKAIHEGMTRIPDFLRAIKHGDNTAGVGEMAQPKDTRHA